MTQKLKVLVVTQYFSPEVFYINKVVESLWKRGNSIAVLTGQPNYPEGKIFKGYHWWSISKKEERGIIVTRVPTIPRGNESSVKLMLNYLSFIFFATTVGVWKLRGCKFDCIYCYAPSPILQAIPAIFVSKLVRAKLILNVQDLWPQSLVSTGNIKNKYVLGAVWLAVKYVYDACDHIVCPSRSFCDDIRSEFNPNCRISYIPNSVNEYSVGDQYKPSISLRRLVEQKKFKAVFAGNIGKAQALEVLVEAANRLRLNAGIVFLVFGGGNQLGWLRDQIDELGLLNVKVLGRYPLEDMPYIMANADCFIATLRDTETFSKTIPNRIQSYLAAGRPIAASISGEGASAIREARCGYVSKPTDGDALARSILKLSTIDREELENFGVNGKKYFLENFEHETVVDRIERLVYRVVGF